VNSSTFVTTPTPEVDVTLNRPAWLTNGASASTAIVSPDGSLSLAALEVAENDLHLRLPSVTNYLSVILQPTPTITQIYPSTNGGFSMAGTGPHDPSYRILATTNLGQPLSNWPVVGSGTFVGGVFQFVDPDPAKQPGRFYRVITP
jgi:hypothetical protein